MMIAPTWYGLMYVLAFVIGYFFMQKTVDWRKKDDLDSLLFFVFLGVLLGGRLGYVLLYNPLFYLTNPLEIFAVWNGGMSFHGGFVGVIVAVLLFSRVKKYPFWHIIDRLAIITPIGLGLGRIGNWINGELPGFAPYDGPFPMTVNGIAHFPSPLMQAFLEGIVFSCIMFTLWKLGQHKKPALASSVFIIVYAIMRLVSEQWRLPDMHIGYLFGTDFFTLGMLYSIIMLLAGIGLLMFTTRLRKKN